MSWRVVVITKKSKLEYKMGYLICRGEETKKVFISEISSLIVESTAVCITTTLLCELIKAKVNVVFCDEKHNPHSQLNSLYGCHDCSGQLKKQLQWNEEQKTLVWTEIVRRKICAQYSFLKELNSPKAVILEEYMSNIKTGDITNREGHSAKVYFDELFGLNFKRGDDNFYNSALNYGYSIILSAINRELISCGINTQIGINHRNEFNNYNLTCDLMEPFRVVVDRFVFMSREESFTSDYKWSLVNILNLSIKINDNNYCLVDALNIYVKSVILAIETGDITKIVNYEL